MARVARADVCGSCVNVDDIPGLRNITVQVDFQRGGRTVYTTTTFAGYIGALSGMRPGAFSIVRACEPVRPLCWWLVKRCPFLARGLLPNLLFA